MSLLQVSKTSYAHPPVVRGSSGKAVRQTIQTINKTDAIRRVLAQFGINTSPAEIKEILANPKEGGIVVTDSNIQAAKKSLINMQKDEEARAEDKFHENLELTIRSFFKWQKTSGCHLSFVAGLELLCTHMLGLFHPDCKSVDFDYDEFMVKLREIIHEQVG